MAFAHLGTLIRAWTKIDQEIINHALDREYQELERSGASPGLLQAILLERDGGPCPLCSKPWGSIYVTQLDANFHYKEPTCSCLGRCTKCGRSLHREHYQGIPCLSCRGL